MKKTIIISILLVLGIFIASLTYAIYRSNSTGTSTLQGATWSVSASGDNSVNLTTGSTSAYTLTVTNNSEVDVEYDIELTNLPSDISVKLDDGSYVQESNNEVTFTNAGTLLYGASPRNHTLTFTTDIDSSVVNNQSVSINVKFKQKIN